MFKFNTCTTFYCIKIYTALNFINTYTADIYAYARFYTRTNEIKSDEKSFVGKLRKIIVNKVKVVTDANNLKKKKTKEGRRKKRKKISYYCTITIKIHSLFHQATPTIERAIINCIKFSESQTVSKHHSLSFARYF